MGQFIHIRSDKFPILPGEEDEIVNDGMYGKALAEYLQSKLGNRGYDVPFVCAEDWGWWVALDGVPFRLGICIYSGREMGKPDDFVCTDSIDKARKWSWRKFGFIDTSASVEKLHADLLAVFRADKDIEILGVTDEFPF